MQAKVMAPSVILILFAISYSHADERQPTLESSEELRSRRDAIYRELDRNVEAVKHCFEILDGTSETETTSREFLDSQIQQYDDRSSVLHDELAEIERYEFLTKHREELIGRINVLEGEAKQLRNSGYQVPAGLRQAKADSIRRSLNDGTWKILANDEWSCESQPTDLISVLQLNAEVEKLKLEAVQLRKNVAQLQKTVERLERIINLRE